MEQNVIKVERETFEKNGKTYYGYFVSGVIRGRQVKVGIKPPDNGGYTVLDIVFDGAMEAAAGLTRRKSLLELNKQDSYFEFTLQEDMTLQRVLASVHSGQQVEVPENASDGNPFPYALIVSSYNGNVSYHIAFNLGAEVTGITIDPPSIVFTG